LIFLATLMVLDSFNLIYLIKARRVGFMVDSAIHGFALLAQNASEQRAGTNGRVFLPSLAVAVIIHSFFNHYL
jgi:hypothetical protein